MYKMLRKCEIMGYKTIYDAINKSINDNNGIMIGKIGSIELMLIFQTLLILLNISKDYNDKLVYEAINTAGLYPEKKDVFIKFTKLYLESIKNIDIMASWNDNIIKIEEYIWNEYININSNHNIRELVDLKSLEPYYTTSNYWWQNLYKNKTILIISPFVRSIQKQLEYPRRNYVWCGQWDNFWDKSIHFKFIKFPHPLNLLDDNIKSQYPNNMFDIITLFKNKITDIGHFDIALLGIGCYSIILASYIKMELKKSSYHLGGGLQIMFGVYGNRWLNNDNPLFKKLFNEYWIRPTGDEIPKYYINQENAAYF